MFIQQQCHAHLVQVQHFLEVQASKTLHDYVMM